jgi:hypothetical protein
MFIRQTVIYEAWCDKCQAGMLQSLLDTGFIFKIKLTEFVGNEIKCEKCGHLNMIDNTIINIPHMFESYSVNPDYNLKDDGMKKHIDQP